MVDDFDAQFQCEEAFFIDFNLIFLEENIDQDSF